MDDFANDFVFTPAHTQSTEDKEQQTTCKAQTSFNPLSTIVPSNALSFVELNLSPPLLRACEEMRYHRATPIQAATIPLVLAGRDICGSAITGSGKTAAFALPLIERLLYRPKNISAIYILIMTPTRELAVQIHDVVKQLGKFANIQVALIVGGFSLQVQAAMLETRPEIVVATPGRLIDHLRNSRSFDLDTVQALVLDEADKLLKMGFVHEIREIVKNLPKERQTMLFSATMTEEVKKLMELSLKRPVRVAADPSGRIPHKLTQQIIRVNGEEMRKKKEGIICALCSGAFTEGRVIIFCSTKKRVHRLKLLFEVLQLPSAGELHAGMSQTARLESLEKFRSKELHYLVATDVAGRGLDIVGVEVVINYDAPTTLDTYLHRIGRTARAGTEGQAITFITDTNQELLKDVIEATRQEIVDRVVPDEKVEYCLQQIKIHERHLTLLIKEEMEEKKLKEAEKEVDRVKNILEHEKEIHARPPKTWFQSQRQRQETKKLARMEDDGLMETDDVFPFTNTVHFDSRPKKKNVRVKKGEKQAAENSRQVGIKEVRSKVRAIKQMHRAYEAEGSNSKSAYKKAQESVLSSKKKRNGSENEFLPKAKKRQRLAEEDHDGHVEKRTPKVYPGGRKSGRVEVQKTSKHKRNRIRRSGKGKHAFKGRTKFKRRR